MRVHCCSKRHLVTPTLKEIRWTRAERPLHCQAENWHENILFTDEKSFTFKEQYNPQNYKIYAQTSREVKENVPRVQRGHHPSYVLVWWGVFHQGVTSSFLEKRVKLVPKCIKRICYKEL
jgi:hypothetical protein